MTKEELKEYRKILLELKGIEDSINSITYLSSPAMTEIRTCNVASSVENIVFKLIQLQEEYKTKQEELISHLGLLEDFIEGIEDSTIRNIYRRRYILGERWEDIGRKLYISEKHCRRLHNKYLSER